MIFWKKYEGSKIIQDRILSLLDRGNAMGQKSTPILYGAGAKKILNNKSIAIVGSRDASIDDLEFAFQLEKSCFVRI